MENGDILAKIIVDDHTKIQRPVSFADALPVSSNAAEVPEFVTKVLRFKYSFDLFSS